MMQPLSIELGRMSAFYAPTIATFAGGYLQQEGLDPRHSTPSPGKSSLEGLLDGSVHVAQSAPSRSLSYAREGERAPFAHFAVVNRRDGFFLLGRNPDPDFTWDKLRSARILADHGAQPLPMLKYAAYKRGLDPESLVFVDAAAEMEGAFREGVGDYIHVQGPTAQQLEADGVGHIVASVGDAIGPVAFTSLAATWEWLATDEARRFTRAYQKAASWVLEAPAVEVADLIAPFLPGVQSSALVRAIETYKRSGTWTPQVAIQPDLFEAALDVFAYAGKFERRPRYEDLIAAPPDGTAAT